MADFELAIPHILLHEVPKKALTTGEGAFTNDPDDPGGPTKWGISLKFLRSVPGGDIDKDGDVDIDDVIKLSLGVTKEIYRLMFWDLYRYGEIKNSKLATKIFDLCVNMGPKKPHVFLQRALFIIGKQIVVDGFLGNKTLAAVNSLNQGEINNVIAHVCQFAEEYYKELIERRPRLAKYKNGWFKRAAFLGSKDTETKWESYKQSEVSSPEVKPASP